MITNVRSRWNTGSTLEVRDRVAQAWYEWARNPIAPALETFATQSLVHARPAPASRGATQA